MYVRSQNRKFLGKVNQAYICGTNNDQIWCDEGTCLGVYLDNDRALEVIDMMQDHLEDGYMIQEVDKETSFTRASIFEMPIR